MENLSNTQQQQEDIQRQDAIDNSSNPQTNIDEEDDGVDYFKQEEDLSQEQEQTLFAFLQKVQRACNDDSSLPDFIGLQVNDWIKELEDKNINENQQPLQDTSDQQQVLNNTNQ